MGKFDFQYTNEEEKAKLINLYNLLIKLKVNVTITDLRWSDSICLGEIIFNFQIGEPNDSN